MGVVDHFTIYPIADEQFFCIFRHTFLHETVSGRDLHEYEYEEGNKDHRRQKTVE